jgi:glycosyltransferase involved in cell wall biosynthesis
VAHVVSACSDSLPAQAQASESVNCEAAVPAGKLIHAIADNYATHKHPKVRAWLASGSTSQVNGRPARRRQGLMIEAFRRLVVGHGLRLELHIAGSAMPGSANMKYLMSLQRQAKDLPVMFHVNVSSEGLAGLYRDAAFYWHAAGLGESLRENPFGAEHFGISIVEAMSAGCVPIVFNSGGPREIVTPGTGVLYDTLEQLVEETARLLDPGSAHAREQLGRSASLRAADFGPPVFRRNVKTLLHQA